MIPPRAHRRPARSRRQVAAELHEAVGVGSNRQEAIGKALQQAAFQVCGVTLESDSASAVSLAVRGDGMEIVESLNEHIRISLGSDACRFTGYEVLSSTPEDGGVRVRVRVSHASYRVPGPDVDRRRLAVLDFEIDEVDAAEGARLGKVLGADYLLYGTVDRIAVEERRTNIQLTGETRTRVLAAAQVRFSVLAVATRQVKWSSAVELEQVAEEDLWPEQLAEAVLDEAAARIADELTENIYPPVVLQALGGGTVAMTGRLAVREAAFTPAVTR